jgi:parallel beta-helix repeat protein
MVKRNGSQIVLFLLLAASLTVAFNIGKAIATGTIYIRADGSIDPPTAPILRNSEAYTLTDDISGSIILQKDNIVVDGAGHALQGTGAETGIDLSDRTNVTIQNMKIETFDYAVYLSSSSNVTISGTNIANSNDGIWLSDSSYSNNILGNNITTNVLEGIYIQSSTDNSIIENNITTNTFDGIYLFSCSNNTVSGNKIANNGDGIASYYSSDNRIFHNNFISNFEQVYSESSTDTWDNSYPSGGNYWNNYAGVDKKCGPSQDHPRSDGMGDTPYTIDSNNKDNYPLVNPWTPPSGHNVAVISAVPSKAVIGQGFTGNITVYAANKGGYSETFNVTVYANMSTIASTTVPLQSGSTTTITFSWTPTNTSFSKGNYSISAYAWPVPSETDMSDNNFTGGYVSVAAIGDLTGGTRNPWDFVPDGKVDGKDITIVALCFGSAPGCPPPYTWNPNSDVNNDGKIDGKDIATVALHFGQAG